MLKKPYRLSTNFEFNVTRKHGQKLTGELSYIYYLLPKNSTGTTRTGIVISTRVHKSAVKRNRLRRLFMECLRVKLPTLPSGLWLVIQPRSKSLGAKYEEICTELDSLLSKVYVA